MTKFLFMTWLAFWQAMPTPTPAEWTDFSGTVIMSGVLGFLTGCILTAIFFLAARQEKNVNSFDNQPIKTSFEQRMDIKLCEQCNSTYTDKDLSFCLRDGTVLKIVGTMPVTRSPDETVVSSKSKLQR